MRNNNGAVIRRLTARSLRTNKRRNFYITMAIALTTLLLASVFSIGMSLRQSIRVQELRLMGTAAHTAVTQPTAAQLEQLRQLPYVKTVGTGNFVGSIKSTPEMGDMNLSLYHFDKTEWEELRAPAVTDIVGRYPQNEDEMMIPLWVLKRLGIESPTIGMEIPLTYSIRDGSENHEFSRVFRLSGWYTSYMHIRSGNIDSLLVSQALSQKHGRTVEAEGVATVRFTDSSPTKIMQDSAQLERDLALTLNQKVKNVPAYEFDSDSIRSNLIALAVIVAFLVLTGYLLIYNVLYISVTQDVRFYGLLKTLGTTPRQIRRIVTGQMVRLCAIGIPVGAAGAALVSSFAVPLFISRMGTISTGSVVSFSPVIYLGAAAFALLTALLGAFKPAQKAARISPIEAQRFTGIQMTKGHAGSSVRGKPYKMALRNIFREKKRAVIVLLSLFLGITTFTTVLTLVKSMNTDNFIASYMKSDFELKNNTLDTTGPPKQKFDAAFMESLHALPGLESVRSMTREWGRLDYSSQQFGDYVTDYLQRNQASHMTESMIANHFSGLIAGIERDDLEELNRTLDKPIDLDAFDRGEIALIATDNPDLFRKVQELTLHPMEQTEEAGIHDEAGARPKTIRLGGYVPKIFEGVGYSLAPTLFVSNSFMRDLYGDPVIAQVNIDVSKGNEKQVLDSLKQLMDKDFEMSRTSKLEAQEEMRDAKLMMYILGGGIALILALIGILNFVNVMSVGIMVRKQELTTLECVGMSRRQVRSMLISEGLGYAAITLVLVFTAGTAATFGIFKLFQQQATYAVFTYPIVPMAIASLLIIAVCVTTPEKVYRSIYRATLVGRLRDVE
ncbi:ABC transporter permease [Gorillibacterium timonense]|uniref:ABC transporter permease n=1 Tax=Gorillibacterium timonense TaxID=1689269 RepID=UPI00071E29FF|nr:ABC transporter permease [Gorillibacterium timonense]